MTKKTVQILLFVYAILSIALHYGCRTDEASGDDWTISCNAENLKTTEGEVFFETSGSLFNNGNTQSREKAHGGNFSSKLTSENPWGISYYIKDAHIGDIYELTVWRYSKSGAGVLAIKSEGVFYHDTGTPIITENGWDYLRIQLTIDMLNENKEIYVHAWLPQSNDSAYFDDLIIRKLPKRKKVSPIFEKTEFESLNILISEPGLQKIRAKRDEALEKRILITNKTDWVQGKLVVKNDTFPVELRLKGDWTDHLRGEKWSFRFKMTGEKYWDGLRTFSIQVPETRHFLDEWVLHQFLRKEDILTTRYDFVYVKLNNKALGVYAMEEHFSKELVERYKRREGPIVKFDEEQLWKIRSENELLDLPYLPVFEASEILPFSKGKTNRDSMLYAQYAIAKNLMFQYKFGLKPASQIFDIEKLAKYFAVLDVTKSYHSLIWHNQRWYFNPVTCKLEPVCFDGYASEGVFDWINSPLTGYKDKGTVPFKHSLHLFNIINSRKFHSNYFRYLNIYSSEKYLSDCFDEFQAQLNNYERLIQKDSPDYQYDHAFLKENISVIHSTINNMVNTKSIDNLQDNIIENYRIPNTDSGFIFPKNDVSVMAYCNKRLSESNLIVFNYYQKPIHVVGIENEFNEFIPLSGKTLDAYTHRLEPDHDNIIVNTMPIRVFYQIANTNLGFSTTVINNVAPANYSPEQELFEHALNNDNLYTIRNDSIIFIKGVHVINEDVIIPENYTVIIPEGTVLDLIDQSKFISKSVVKAFGSTKNPVKIISSDSAANGFTILQAGGISYLHNVQFHNLNTLNYNGWTLTGAVTFYESDVVFKNCSFIGSKCEDALNIIRSDFLIKNCRFEDSSFDAFDADYCSGKIEHTTFSHQGNDAIDVSGSKVLIDNCIINKTGDKGVSGGENAQIIINNSSIDWAQMGVASKDFSLVSVNHTSINNCEYGFGAYQKKPEFGPAKIFVENCTMKNLQINYITEVNSLLIIDGKTIKGRDEISTTEMFY